MITIVVFFDLGAEPINLTNHVPRLGPGLLFLTAHAGTPPNVFTPEHPLLRRPD